MEKYHQFEKGESEKMKEKKRLQDVENYILQAIERREAGMSDDEKIKEREGFLKNQIQWTLPTLYAPEVLGGNLEHTLRAVDEEIKKQFAMEPFFIEEHFGMRRFDGRGINAPEFLKNRVGSVHEIQLPHGFWPEDVPSKMSKARSFILNKIIRKNITDETKRMDALFSCARTEGAERLVIHTNRFLRLTGENDPSLALKKGIEFIEELQNKYRLPNGKRIAVGIETIVTPPPRTQTDVEQSVLNNPSLLYDAIKDHPEIGIVFDTAHVGGNHEIDSHFPSPSEVLKEIHEKGGMKAIINVHLNDYRVRPDGLPDDGYLIGDASSQMSYTGEIDRIIQLLYGGGYSGQWVLEYPPVDFLKRGKIKKISAFAKRMAKRNLSGTGVEEDVDMVLKSIEAVRSALKLPARKR